MHLTQPIPAPQRMNFERTDTGSTKVERCRPCRSISVSMPTDIVEVAEVPRCQCAGIAVVGEPDILGEKLDITDEEREKAPPFCDMKKIISGKGEQLIYVGWNGPDDPANPRNWSPRRKWFLSVVGFFFCTLVSMSVSAYSVVVTSVQEELGTSRLLAISGLSIFTLTFGAAPLVLAPLSEVSLPTLSSFFALDYC